VTIEALFEQLREDRSEESFRLLFDRFYWPLFRFFERRGFSREECQDLVQETFLRVHRGIEDFRGEAHCVHWLFRIAANTAGKAMRYSTAARRAGDTVSLEDQDVEEAPAPLRQLLGKERQELLRQAIDGLPAQMRRCVRMRVFQDLDYEEIAEALQISPSTVKVQLFKARKRLQSELEDSLVDFDL
jgi:RNA polymerase sigma-70 factor (ECF subfamily)